MPRKARQVISRLKNKGFVEDREGHHVFLIYESVAGKEKNFNQYFLGANGKEKNTLLSYVIYFLIAIIVLNIVSLWLNSFL